MEHEPLQNPITALHQQIVSLQQSLQAARLENTVLRQKLDALARRFFGKKSEQLDPAQLELLLSGLADGRLEETVEETKEQEPPAPTVV